MFKSIQKARNTQIENLNLILEGLNSYNKTELKLIVYELIKSIKVKNG